MPLVEEEVGDDGNPAPGASVKTIRYDRFQHVVSERNTLRDELKTIKAQAQTAAERAATADTLATQLEAARAELATKSNAWNEERGLYKVGLVEADDIDLARLYHAKTPVEGRKPLADWFAEVKANPSAAPRPLQAILGPPVAAPAPAPATPAPGTAGTAQAAQTAPGVPQTSKGATTGGQLAANEPLSAEKLREIRQRCEVSGDWTEWRKTRG